MKTIRAKNDQKRTARTLPNFNYVIYNQKTEKFQEYLLKNYFLEFPVIIFEFFIDVMSLSEFID
jgi:hypothetical protein